MTEQEISPDKPPNKFNSNSLEDPHRLLASILLEIGPLTPGIIIGLISIAVLLMISATIAAMEIGFFSLSPQQLQELENSGKPTAQKIIQLLQKPKNLIATIVLSHNLVNIGVVIISESLSDDLLLFPNNPGLVFFVKVVVVTFFIVLIGEVIPKIYTNTNPVAVAQTLVYPLDFLQKLFRPLSFLLIQTSSIFDSRLKSKAQSISVEDLSQALELTSNEHTPEEERKILEGIVEFGNTEVKEIMRSRMDIIGVEIETGFHDLLNEILSSGFSRVPVYRDSLDKVEGILVMKDLLPFINEENDFNWKKLIRKPFFVPATKKIDDLLKEFQRKKNHMAIVVDEYGGTSGLVTLEDILEEILGEINDEFDDDELVYSRLDDFTIVFEGKIALNDFYRVLRIDGYSFEERRGEADTLAGFILELSGKIPMKNEKIFFDDYTFIIESADKRKINRVKVLLPPEKKDEDQSSGNILPDKAGIFSLLTIMGLTLLLSACDPEYTPKPKAYFRIDFPAKEYQDFNTDCPFSFKVPAYSIMKPYVGKKQEYCWYNLEFKGMRATLHLSYLPLNNNLPAELRDSRELVYKHTVKADAIEEEPIINAEHKVYGLIYHLSGNTASAKQFYLTDSTRHFVRGALYFNCPPNSDSLAPVVDFLSADIYQLIESFRWKNPD